MKTFARIDGARVVELLDASADPALLFHRDITWIEVERRKGVAVNWTYQDGQFTPPAKIDEAPEPVTIAILHARLSVLAAQLETLTTG